MGVDLLGLADKMWPCPRAVSALTGPDGDYILCLLLRALLMERWPKLEARRSRITSELFNDSNGKTKKTMCVASVDDG